MRKLKTVYGARIHGEWPNETAINSTGAGAADGMPYEKALADDYIIRAIEEIFERAGIIPNDIAESATNKQILEAHDAAGHNNTKKLTFSQAGSRANLASGETLAAIMGKLQKWYADLTSNADGFPNFASRQVAFSQAGSRANLASGETLAAIMGKLQKWYADINAIEGFSRVQCWPVGTYYTQYALANGTFDGNEAPNVKFGGTWTLQYNSEGVFFRTEGGASADQRLNGIQADRIRNITGKVLLYFGFYFGFKGDSTTASPTSALYLSDDGTARQTPSSATHENYIRTNNVLFSASRNVATGTDIAPRNRTIRVWKRTS
ncbi:MAG: hypothetical protein LBD20_02670 [Spirochaetaceae bacterium]|jgi:hypothetical protein|nr:hypothetical protein [Spirochaetaceae bacterium]